MYFNRKCKITFISHGATIHSEEGRFSDLLNYPPLSELGVEEVQNVVSYLKARGIKNDAIYTSPSVRALQTATLVSKLFKHEYEVIDDLYSRKLGEWNGLTYSQILAKYPNAFLDMISAPDKKLCKDFESNVEFVNRVKKVADLLVENNIGNRIIIVTHPDIIQAAICAALNLDSSKLSQIYIRTGSITQISYFETWASLIYCDHVPMQF